jgi:hypothetical protein
LEVQQTEGEEDMRLWFSGLTTATLAAQAFAAHLDNSLLSLVPAGAEIVAGIQDPHSPNSRGRLLLVTHNNNLDLSDWLALTGVDSHRGVDELVEVATSSAQGELTGHLLLIGELFNRQPFYHRGSPASACRTFPSVRAQTEQ